MSVMLTPLEQALLNRIQGDFPLCHDPYGELGRAAGCTREEAHAAIQRLRARGIIRRIGGSFSASHLGYVSLLVAAQVEHDCLEAVAQRINTYREVTHNYERDGRYNLWFTVIAETADRIAAILDDVRACTGVQALQPLPAVETLKIQVHFAFTGEAHAA